MTENEDVRNEEVEEIKPQSWFEELEDGKFICRTKEGDFELEEINGKKLKSIRRRSSKIVDGRNTTDMALLTNLLIAESLVKPKIADRELDDLKVSTLLKLESAMEQMYGISDFLQK